MKGLTVGIEWRGLEIPAAFLKLREPVSAGTAQTGHNGRCQVFASVAAYDAGKPQIDDFPVTVPGSASASGPGGDNAPVALDATEPTPTEWNTDAVGALYAKLQAKYPKAVAV